ncbi:hypothetical protein [Telluribacter sp. SYSU D00476]|uniref:hypothetical protein n=1 Tax=Telluribacter sp. SYSU D00476 TaxID=2811430 RepID=UPI001FF62AD7|nr:hypothetical protein [Telluribacter sp. SYSU D00476]
MKHFIPLAALLLLCACLFIGCKKNGDPVVPVETSPYIGLWAGTTNAGDSLKFTVSDVQGKIMLTGYDVDVRMKYNGKDITIKQKETNSAGYAEVVDSKISYKLNGIEINFNFTSPTTLVGAYRGEVPMPSPTVIEGTFIAKKK